MFVASSSIADVKAAVAELTGVLPVWSLLPSVPLHLCHLTHPPIIATTHVGMQAHQKLLGLLKGKKRNIAKGLPDSEVGAVISLASALVVSACLRAESYLA